MSPEEKEQAAAAALKRREDGGAVVFYVEKGGQSVDLLRHKPGSMAYTVLRAFAKWNYQPGDVKTLSQPFDQQVVYSARDMAIEVLDGR